MKKSNVTFWNMYEDKLAIQQAANNAMNLKIWSHYSLSQRIKVATYVARKQAQKDVTDPTTFSRVYSNLVNCVYSPQEFGLSADDQRKIAGIAPIVGFNQSQVAA